MKAPRFPSYEEAVMRKRSNKKLLTKEEWLELEETKIIKQKEKHKKCANKRKLPVTISFRTSREERDMIFEKIKFSGLQRQEYMTNAILKAPIQVVATKKVIDYCKGELKLIGHELERLTTLDDFSKLSYEKLMNIMEVIKAAIKNSPQ